MRTGRAPYGTRSNLFIHVKRVYLLAKEKFPWAQVHVLMESVASMDETDRCIMSEHMGFCPYLVDAEGISICRRPRLYWVSWELRPAPGITFVEHHSPGWGSFTEVKLTHNIEVEDFLREGWHWVRRANCQPLPRLDPVCCQAIDRPGCGSVQHGKSSGGRRTSIGSMSTGTSIV